MTPMFSTALIGFFLLSNVATTTLPATNWTKESSEVPTYQTYTVAMTGYNAVPAQTDESSDLTASGTIPVPGVTAARSRDLADVLPFGTVIEIVPTDGTSNISCGLDVIDDIGLRVITDTMHQRKKNQIDILFDTDTVLVGKRRMNPAVAFGFCKSVEIRVIGRIDIAHMPRTQTELELMLGEKILVVNG